MMVTREDILLAHKLGEPGGPAAGAATTRRTFLKISGTLAGGLLVSVDWRLAAVHQSVGAAQAGAFQPSPFIRIDADSRVTIWSRNPDMGEGVKTSLSMLIAEELDADWARVTIENAPLDRRFGPQGIGGSDAIASAWDDHRRAGATARHMLVAAAAATWNVPTSEVVTRSSTAQHPRSGRRASYGDLAARAATMAVPDVVTLKEAATFGLIGTRASNVDNRAIVSGRRLFGLDVKVAGMKYAAVAKAPVFGARAASIDRSAALRVPGVRQVVEIDGLPNPTHLMPGVAVVADSTYAAFRGREALRVAWSETAFANESSQTLSDEMAKLLAAPAFTLHDTGTVDRALAQSTTSVDCTYEFAFVAHAPLEPPNCTADVREGECFVTGPLQMPASGRQIVAAAIGIPPERVHVQATRIGGGFGRRLMSDHAAEAAVISKAIGAPVQVVDDRAGDLQHDYYRPAAAQRIRAGLDAEGRLQAWDHVLVSVSRNAYRLDSRPPYATETYGALVGRVTTPEQMNPDLQPTRISNARLRYAAPRTGVPTGAWRAPSHVVNAFAIETTIDELAAKATRSAVDLRLEFLGETGDIPPNPHARTLYDPSRLRRVLLEVAERGAYGRRPPEGRARGLAAHFTFGSYCAQVVELSLDSRQRVVIHSVTAVADVGQPVNLSGLEAQAEGGIIDGLGAAFFGNVPIEHGRATVANFDRYRLIRHREAPAVIAVSFVPSRVAPSGFGEIAVPPIAPAVANALAALTGRRLRRMPFVAAGVDLSSSHV
jgi:isoquinoline 1-oxidoreductase subunit beta